MARRDGTRSPGLFDAPAPPLESEAAGRFAQVALDRPVPTDFTYRAAEGARLEPGMRVEVPFGSRREVGIVVALTSVPDCDPRKVRSILRILDAEPSVEPGLLELARRIASHYACSKGEALAAMLPAPLRQGRERREELIVVARPVEAATLAELEARAPERHRALRVLREAGGELSLADLLRTTKLSSSPVKTLAKQGLVRLERRPAAGDPLLAAKPVARSTPLPLTDEQAAAVEAIAAAAEARRFEPFLLFGVTGSGKTEVYLQALERTLAAGRDGIVLVPEISLTPQTVERFRARFGDVAVLHSHLTDRDRATQWTGIRERKLRVVVGARSAVFAPVADLGLLVVDEEHEPSFKQGSVPRYHARDVALVRGQLAGAAVVLGSATPSLESWKRAIDGRTRLLRLSQRVAGGALPPVRIADLRREKAREMHLGAAVPITRPLRDAVVRALEKKKRVILFLNRRGFAPALWCPACATTVRCSRCSASLTFHKRIGRLVCHLCARETPLPEACPKCGAPRPRLIGAGTERIEQAVARAFATAHVARMDSDATVSRGSHEAILDKFRRGEIDILVGTQMIAKGLDVPEVTVVGVMNADAALHIPEFHSAERTFQLVAQVAGRAGRGAAAGEVIVQSAMPEHPAIALAAKHDFESFARGELRERERYRYPPYTRLVRVLVEARPDAKARKAIEAAAALFANDPIEGVELLGPEPAPIEQVKGKSRWHFLLRCDPPERIRALRERLAALAARPLPGRVRAAVDVDPLSTL